MRKIYLFLGICSFGVAGCFLWLTTIFLHADGMTQEEYARQAQELVCMQTVGESGDTGAFGEKNMLRCVR